MRHFETVPRILLTLIALMCLAGTAAARSITILPGTPASSINALIATGIPGDRIMLGEGVFSMKEPLIIARDGVFMTGAGRFKTILSFDVEAGDFLQITGGDGGSPIAFLRSARRGATEITLANTAGLKAGDAIYIHTPNTRSFIAQWQNVRWNEAKDRPFRESIHVIKSVDENRLKLATPLPFAMEKGAATAQKIVLRQNVTISDLTVKSALGKAGEHDFSNSLPSFNRAAAIRSRLTRNLSLKHVKIADSPSTALLLESSIDADIQDIVIDGAHNKGGGGNGYGVELRGAHGNALSDLVIENMRHAVIFSAWHAETSNFIHVKKTNRDINFHGSIDLENTVIVDELALSYASDRSSSKRRNVWKALSAGGTNHAETDFLSSNTVMLKHAAGSWRDDVLVGAESAVLAGGFGKDRFVLGSGATILDFEEGDRLAFTKAQPVGVEERGRDIVLRLADGGEIVLRDQL